MDMQTNHALPIACDPAAIDIEVRSTHLSAAEKLLRHDAVEVQELPDGFAFRYPAEQFSDPP